MYHTRRKMVEMVAPDPGHRREPSGIDFATSNNFTFPAHYHLQPYTLCTKASHAGFDSGVRRLRPKPGKLATLP